MVNMPVFPMQNIFKQDQAEHGGCGNVMVPAAYHGVLCRRCPSADVSVGQPHQCPYGLS